MNEHEHETTDQSRGDRLRYAHPSELPRGMTADVPALTWEHDAPNVSCPICGAEVIGLLSRRRHVEWHASIAVSR